VIDTLSGAVENSAKNSYVDASKRATLLANQLIGPIPATRANISQLIFH
jgi:hypothetical protein